MLSICDDSFHKIRNISKYMPQTIKDSVVWLLGARALSVDVELLQRGAFISLVTVAGNASAQRQVLGGGKRSIPGEPWKMG